ncbi:MAG: hypothetical protein ABR512_03445 [Desulfopila sp.]
MIVIVMAVRKRIPEQPSMPHRMFGSHIHARLKGPGVHVDTAGGTRSQMMAGREVA